MLVFLLSCTNDDGYLFDTSKLQALLWMCGTVAFLWVTCAANRTSRSGNTMGLRNDDRAG